MKNVEKVKEWKRENIRRRKGRWEAEEMIEKIEEDDYEKWEKSH